MTTQLHHITFFTWSGKTVGLGSLAVDQSILSGYSNSEVSYNDLSPVWLGAIVEGILFDEAVWRQGFAQVSIRYNRIWSLYQDSLISSKPFNTYPEHELIFGESGTWNLKSHYPTVAQSENSVLVNSGRYIIAYGRSYETDLPQITSISD